MLRERVCTAGGWGHWFPGSMDAAGSEAEGQVQAAGRSGLELAETYASWASGARPVTC